MNNEDLNEEETSAEAAISEFAETIGEMAFNQYIYKKLGNEWHLEATYNDEVRKVDAVALESGPGKYKSVIRYKSGEIDKKGKPEWKTQTRVFNISPRWAKAHKEYLELNGLAAPAAEVAARPAGLLESLDIGKLKELVSFIVGLKAIMSGTNTQADGGQLKEVYASHTSLQTELLKTLIAKDNKSADSSLMPLLLEMMRRPQSESNNMDKMLEVLKEGINLGRDTSQEDEGGPMEKMMQSLLPSLAPALAGAAFGNVAPAANVAPSAAPRVLPSAKRQAPALPADVGSIVAQLKSNPEMAKQAHAQITAAYGKDTADKLAKEYGLLQPQNKPSKQVKII